MKTATLVAICIAAMLAGCAAGVPYIAPMQLAAPQLEIVDIITDMGQEILIFDYNAHRAFTDIEVRGEFFRYGEWGGSLGGNFPFNEAVPIADGKDIIL